MSVNHLNQQQVKSREDYKKIKSEEKKKVEVNKKKVEVERPITDNRIRIRLIPIWLRIVLLVVLILGCTVAGAAVGYGVIGDGKAADVFKESTWTHILDLVEKK
jgi:DNA-directed RNA polymerase subunit beta